MTHPKICMELKTWDHWSILSCGQSWDIPCSLGICICYIPSNPENTCLFVMTCAHPIISWHLYGIYLYHMGNPGIFPSGICGQSWDLYRVEFKTWDHWNILSHMGNPGIFPSGICIGYTKGSCIPRYTLTFDGNPG